MRAVIQRVKNASVSVDGRITSEIGTGLLILLGIAQDDTEEKAKEMAEKIANLRIMADEEGPPATPSPARKDSVSGGRSDGRRGKMNKSILDIKGEILVVSQFTLLADTSGGRRPSFIKAADPAKARELYELFVKELGKLCLPAGGQGVSVKTGKFGQYMRVSLVNDGPVTIILDH